MKAPVMIMEIVATRDPVPQCGEDSLPSRHHTFLKLSVVAMPEDHGVKALPESIPGEIRHLSGNNLLGAAHILLTDLGTPAGDRPKQGQGQEPLQNEECPAPKNPPQAEITMVCLIHQIAMTDKGLFPAQIKGRPVFIDVHTLEAGEIPGQEKIVIALTEMNGNAPGLEVLQYGDDFPESRVYLIPAAEPEIEEIPEDKKMIEDRDP